MINETRKSVNILNLPDWEILDVKENCGDYLIVAKYVPEPATCPMCNWMLPRLDHFGVRRQCFLDLPIHAKRVGILVHRQRYRCKECGQTFMETLPDMHEKRKATRRLIEHIEQETLQRTFVSIAEDVGMSEGNVRAIFREYIARLEETYKANVPPRWMGLDEIKIVGWPRCIVTNIEKQTIVEVLKDRTKKTATRYLMSMQGRDQIELVAMNMWGPYREAVRAALPGAVIVIDKYHVVCMANTVLDAIRKSVREELTASQCRRLMHDRLILLKREKELDPHQLLILDGWLGEFAPLKAAYKLKERFFNIWDTAKDSKEARKQYEKWKTAIPSEIAWAFKDLTTAIKNWENEIFAYFDYRITNAHMEALNSITRLVYHVSRGYSFEAVRAKMLFNGGLHIERRPPYAKRQLQEFPMPYGYQPPDDGSDLNYGVMMISTIVQRLEDGQL